MSIHFAAWLALLLIGLTVGAVLLAASMLVMKALAEKIGAAPALAIVFTCVLAMAVTVWFVALYDANRGFVPATPIDVESGDTESHNQAEESAAWAAVDPQQFTSDVYPSIESALETVALQVRERLDAGSVTAERPTADPGTTPDTLAEEQPGSDGPAPGPDRNGGTITVVKVYGENLPETHRVHILAQFRDCLQMQVSHSEVHLISKADAAARSNDDDSVVLALTMSDLHDQTAPWNRQTQQLNGLIRCEIEAPVGSTPVTCGFIQKPWVEDFDLFVSADPQRHLVVGYSGEFVSSETQARRRALQDAVAKSRIVVDGVVVHANDSQIIDRFAQKLSRPYGDVWREAVLLDVSPHRVAPVIAATHHHVARAQRRQTWEVLGIVTVFGTALLICVILNRLTQGYYRGRLMVVGGVAAVLAAGFLLLTIRYFSLHQRPADFTGTARPVPVVPQRVP